MESGKPRRRRSSSIASSTVTSSRSTSWPTCPVSARKPSSRTATACRWRRGQPAWTRRAEAPARGRPPGRPFASSHRARAAHRIWQASQVRIASIASDDTLTAASSSTDHGRRDRGEPQRPQRNPVALLSLSLAALRALIPAHVPRASITPKESAASGRRTSPPRPSRVRWSPRRRAARGRARRPGPGSTCRAECRTISYCWRNPSP